MSRLATPASIDPAPAAARPHLEAVHAQIGSMPNLFRLVANSPAALEGYLGMSGALAKVGAGLGDSVAQPVDACDSNPNCNRYYLNTCLLPSS